MKLLYLTYICLLLLTGCNSSKKVPNYKVVNGGYIIWRYTKPGETQKDILSTGDTIISTKDSLYVKSKTRIANTSPQVVRKFDGTITVPPPVKDTIIHLFQFHGYNGGIDSSKIKNKTKQ